MWTSEESRKAHEIAKSVISGIITFALPQGLQLEKGPGAVVEYIEENLPSTIEAAGFQVQENL